MTQIVTCNRLTLSNGVCDKQVLASALQDNPCSVCGEWDLGMDGGQPEPASAAQDAPQAAPAPPAPDTPWESASEPLRGESGDVSWSPRSDGQAAPPWAAPGVAAPAAQAAPAHTEHADQPHRPEAPPWASAALAAPAQPPAPAGDLWADVPQPGDPGPQHDAQPAPPPVEQHVERPSPQEPAPAVSAPAQPAPAPEPPQTAPAPPNEKAAGVVEVPLPSPAKVIGSLLGGAAVAWPDATVDIDERADGTIVVRVTP